MNFISISRQDAIAHLERQGISVDPNLKGSHLEALMDDNPVSTDHDGYYVIEPE